MLILISRPNYGPRELCIQKVVKSYVSKRPSRAEPSITLLQPYIFIWSTPTEAMDNFYAIDLMILPLSSLSLFDP